MPQADASNAVRLPPIRQDLQLCEGGRSRSGAPVFVLHDPLANRFFRLDEMMVVVLADWPLGDIHTVCARATKRLGRVVNEGDIETILHFLGANQLLQESPSKQQASYPSAWQKVTSFSHKLLFMRIPLWRPQLFLDFFWPLVAPLFTRGAVIVFTAMAFCALYLAGRQWDAWLAQFRAAFSFDGALLFAAALVFVKAIHELGHAFMARRYNVEVPVIGVALIIFMPVLYTDTSAAWRLPDRRKRLMIDSAGIFAELMLAVIATVLWVFLADEVLRSVMFSVATVSWVMSLAVNLNPFMRFDGYHILADLLGLENLQGRGFAMARWRMRETLFSLGKRPPEIMEPGLRRLVIVHAWATWLYRLVLFIGIALLVYHFFIKAVGIALFVIEIVIFVAMPIVKELKEWWTMRDDIRNAGRMPVLGGTLAVLALLCVLPLSARVHVPAVVHGATELQVFPPHPGVLSAIDVREGQRVSAGDVLARIESDKLVHDLRLNTTRLELLRLRIRRQIADARDLAARNVLERERQTLLAERAGLIRQQTLLTIRAPIDAVVSDVALGLHEGRMVSHKVPLFRLRSPGENALSALADEAQTVRLSKQAEGRFIPDRPGIAPLDVRLSSISETASAALSEQSLSAQFGGRIATREEAGALVPVTSHYRLRLDPAGNEGDGAQAYGQSVRGVVVLDAERRSLAGRFFRRVAGVLVRESGF